MPHLGSQVLSAPQNDAPDLDLSSYVAVLSHLPLRR